MVIIPIVKIVVVKIVVVKIVERHPCIFKIQKKTKVIWRHATQIELFFQKYLTVILKCTYKVFIHYVLNGI